MICNLRHPMSLRTPVLSKYKICVAGRCSVLQCVEARAAMIEWMHTAPQSLSLKVLGVSTSFKLCNTLQHTAAHCNTLQHTVTHCKTVCILKTFYRDLRLTVMHCNTLQHTATYCNTLQHTATHCNALQHIATLCNTLQRTATQCVRSDFPLCWVPSYNSNTLQHTATQ